MSATNRGLPRQPNDAYDTPSYLIDAFLKEIKANWFDTNEPLDILEPASGSGSIVNSLNRYFPNSEIHALDIEPRGCGIQQDFLTYETDYTYDLIISNPPFTLCKEFVEKSLTLVKPGGLVAMLTRLNWLGAIKRAKWFRQIGNSPRTVFITPKRPKFSLNKKGKLGSDACEYGFMAFTRNIHWDFPGFVWLETEDL